MASDSPAISVVMPVLNPEPAFLKQAIASLQAQTFRDFELVVIEEPSPRIGENIIASFGDPRMRYVFHPTRTTLVGQLNLGLSFARADLVARLDCDDICEPNRLHEQYEFMSQHPEVAVLGSQLTIIDHNGNQVGCRVYPQDHQQIVRAMAYFNPLAHPSVIYRKATVLKAGGYRDFPGCEDYDLWSRLAKNGVRFANHAHKLLRYRVHLGGFKGTKLRQTLRDTVA